MTSIQPSAPALPIRTAGRPRAGQSAPTGFAVTDASLHVVAASGALLEVTDCQYGLLSLQDDGMTPDEQGRRRARSLLARLTGLQLGLLGSVGALQTPALMALRTELDGLPIPTDPRLREALAAIALRVEVELARHEQSA